MSESVLNWLAELITIKTPYEEDRLLSRGERIAELLDIHGGWPEGHGRPDLDDLELRYYWSFIQGVNFAWPGVTTSISSYIDRMRGAK